MSTEDLSSFSMEELFRAEAEVQCRVLSDGLLALEKSKAPGPLLENLMRSAHSLKGAARIIGLDLAVPVAHSMEECFVKAQKTQTAPPPALVDVLFRGVDLLRQLSGLLPGKPTPEEVETFTVDCVRPPEKTAVATPSPAEAVVPEIKEEVHASQKRDVRLDSDRLDTLLGLAGQAVVASQGDGRGYVATRGALRQLQNLLAEAHSTPDENRRSAILAQALAVASQTQSVLVEQQEEHEIHSRRLTRLCNRIYNETLSCRLRPFGDITSGLRRMARDLARTLGKELRVEVSGEETEVDRDLLDQLDGPLSHLIRNALDHGIEFPDERVQAGKAIEGELKISARHQSGWLVITISDDGRGLDYDAIRAAIVKRGLAAQDHVNVMPEIELLDFLLLPGFSLREKVTEVSGRGVGLDAVRAVAYASGGSLRLSRRDTGGFVCEIILPVSLSLVRALIVEISGDYFALPLTRVERVMELSSSELHAAGGRQHAFFNGERLEILSAAQVLELDETPESSSSNQIVVVQGPQGRLGLAVDRLVGQRELSLQRLDARLGRLQDVSATALLDDGEPVVVLDVNDLAITAAHFSSGSRYRPIGAEKGETTRGVRRILVADDSLTVRELERKLLVARGYAVETAVDGADAWNALRSGDYDLLVTDIDMPRMDGIELSRSVRADSRLRDLPIIVVSYKDREEDRTRGLEAGADFYLPKSSYQDESLLKAVHELIGDPAVV